LRLLPVAACLAVAAALAGCSSTGGASTATAVKAKGSTLVIYLSQPPAMNPVQKQVLQAEQLACPSSPQPVGGTHFSVRCNVVARSEPSANAREAIQDESTIAYVGEIQPGTSEQTVGITNALDILQVSPTDTAVELTQETQMEPRNAPKPNVSRAPSHYYESGSAYGRTYARIVPSSAQEAAATVAEMKKLGVKALWVQHDGSDYGRALAAAVRTDANAQGLAIQPSETASDAIFYAADSTSAADTFARNASSTATAEKLFLPSALAGLSFGSGGWSRFRSIYVSQPGVPASADKAFRAQFAARYPGAPPGPQAVFGYAAVQTVLHAIDVAGKNANDRATVVRDLHHLSGFASKLGPLSIGGGGDSSLGSSDFVFSRVRAGKLVPVK
jgi:ABC-type branched-subunit amino acid transport system substrate-binding protein